MNSLLNRPKGAITGPEDLGGPIVSVKEYGYFKSIRSTEWNHLWGLCTSPCLPKRCLASIGKVAEDSLVTVISSWPRSPMVPCSLLSLVALLAPSWDCLHPASFRTTHQMFLFASDLTKWALSPRLHLNFYEGGGRAVMELGPQYTHINTHKKVTEHRDTAPKRETLKC